MRLLLLLLAAAARWVDRAETAPPAATERLLPPLVAPRVEGFQLPPRLGRPRVAGRGAVVRLAQEAKTVAQDVKDDAPKSKDVKDGAPKSGARDLFVKTNAAVTEVKRDPEKLGRVLNGLIKERVELDGVNVATILYTVARAPRSRQLLSPALV